MELISEDYETLDSTNTAPFWQNSSTENLDIINGSYPEKTPLLNTVTTSVPFVPLGLGIIIVTVLGIIGNLLSAIVLSRKRLQSSYSVLTLGLTFVDSVYLVTKLLRYGMASLFSYCEIAKAYTNIALPIVGPYLRAITFTAHTASTYFTIAIAIDRFIAINRQATARTFCTRKRALVTSLVVIFWSFLFNITRWLEFRTVQVNATMDGEMEEHYKMELTELRTDPKYKEVYIFWVYLIVMFVVPFVTLTVLNLGIFLGIRKMIRDGVVLTSTQKRDTSFSIMLIGVVVVFLVCNVDYLVLDILDYIGIAFSPTWNHLGNFLLTLNSAVNFIIYCLCGWKFRQELWKLVGPMCPCFGTHGSHDIATADESQWVKDTMNMDVRSIPRVSLSKASSKSMT